MIINVMKKNSVISDKFITAKRIKYIPTKFNGYCFVYDNHNNRYFLHINTLKNSESPKELYKLLDENTPEEDRKILSIPEFEFNYTKTVDGYEIIRCRYPISNNFIIYRKEEPIYLCEKQYERSYHKINNEGIYYITKTIPVLPDITDYDFSPEKLNINSAGFKNFISKLNNLNEKEKLLAIDVASPVLGFYLYLILNFFRYDIAHKGSVVKKIGMKITSIKEILKCNKWLNEKHEQNISEKNKKDIISYLAEDYINKKYIQTRPGIEKIFNELSFLENMRYPGLNKYVTEMLFVKERLTRKDIYFFINNQYHRKNCFIELEKPEEESLIVLFSETDRITDLMDDNKVYFNLAVFAIILNPDVPLPERPASAEKLRELFIEQVRLLFSSLSLIEIIQKTIYGEKIISLLIKVFQLNDYYSFIKETASKNISSGYKYNKFNESHPNTFIAISPKILFAKAKQYLISKNKKFIIPEETCYIEYPDPHVEAYNNIQKITAEVWAEYRKENNIITSSGFFPSQYILERLFPEKKFDGEISSEYNILITPEYYYRYKNRDSKTKHIFFGYDLHPWLWTDLHNNTFSEYEYSEKINYNFLNYNDIKQTSNYEIIETEKLLTTRNGAVPDILKFRLIKKSDKGNITIRSIFDLSPDTPWKDYLTALIKQKIFAKKHDSAALLVCDIKDEKTIKLLNLKTGLSVLSTEELIKQILDGSINNTVIYYYNATLLLEPCFSANNKSENDLNLYEINLNIYDESEELPNNSIYEINAYSNIFTPLKKLAELIGISGNNKLIIIDPRFSDIDKDDDEDKMFHVHFEWLDSSDNLSRTDNQFIINKDSFSREQATELILGKVSELSKHQIDCLDKLKKSSDKNDHLIILPTGSGKSAIFQIEALRIFHDTGKLTVVFSPLSSLAEEQVKTLNDNGLSRIVAGLHSETINRKMVCRSIASGELAIIYVSPERLLDPVFRESLDLRYNRDGGPGMFVFDEAHCLESWGLTFRPAYLRALDIVSEFLKNKNFTSCKTIFCSATVNQTFKKIPEDFCNNLGRKLIVNDPEQSGLSALKSLKHVFISRTEIINKTDTSGDELHELLRDIARHLLNKKFNGDKSRALIYSSRRDITEMAVIKWNENKNYGTDLTATFFHAGLPVDIRDKIYKKFNNGNYSILFATEAFGMGMDTPNIHAIFHLDAPDSVESYIQKTGRANRSRKHSENAGYNDTNKCISIVYYDDQHLKSIRDNFIDNFITKQEVGEIHKNITQIKSDKVIWIAGEKSRQAYKFYRGKEYLQEMHGLWRLENSGHLELIEILNDAFCFISGERSIHQLNPERGNRGAVARYLKKYNEGINNKIFISHQLLLNDGEEIEKNEYLSQLFGLHADGYIKCNNPVYLKKGKEFDEDIISETHPRLQIFSEAVRFIIDNTDEDNTISFNFHDNDGLIININDKEKSFEELKLHHYYWIIKIIDIESSSRRLYDIPGKIIYTFTLYEREKAEEKLDETIKIAQKFINYFKKNFKDHQCIQENLFTILTKSSDRSNSIYDIETAFGLLRSLALIITTLPLIPHGIEIKIHERNLKNRNLNTIITDRDSGLKRTFAVDVMACLKGDEIPVFCDTYLSGEKKLLDIVDEMVSEYPGKKENSINQKTLENILSQMKEEAFEKEYNQLSEEQKLLVDSSLYENIIVDAGPGSGKTHTIILRLARLILKEHVRPENILVIAYNRSVVLEIKRRLRELFQKMGFKNPVKKIHVHTFHSLTKKLIPEKLNEIENDNSYKSRDELFKEYEPKLIEAIKANPAGLKAILGNIRFLFIDEFQDVNWRRIKIINQFTGIFPEMKICVIGDSDQSIYGYERTTLKNIVNINNETKIETNDAVPYFEYFKNTYCKNISKPLILAENRRSNIEIINYSRQFGTKNATSFKGKGGKVTEIKFNDINNYNNLITEIITKTVKQSNDILTIGLLFRSNKQLYSTHQLIKNIVSTFNNVTVKIQGESQRFIDIREVYYYMDAIGNKMPFHLDYQNSLKIIKKIHMNNWDREILDIFIGLLEEYIEEAGANSNFNDFSEFIRSIEPRDSQYLFKILQRKRNNHKMIILSTVHKAKGLEYDSVIYHPDRNNNAETRRINYVACTRAKNVLYIINDYNGKDNIVEWDKSITLSSPALIISNDDNIFKQYINFDTKHDYLLCVYEGGNHNKWNIYTSDKIKVAYFYQNINKITTYKISANSIYRYTFQQAQKYDEKNKLRSRNGPTAPRWSLTAQNRGFILLPKFSVLIPED